MRNRGGAGLFRAGVLVALIGLAPGVALADNTGWLAPSLSDGVGFASPDNAFASDNAYSTTSTNGTQQAYANFNVSIPAGATINGIEVSVEGKTSSTNGGRTFGLQLSGNAGGAYTTGQNSAALTTSDATLTVGSNVDTWGTSWAVGNFTNANFRVRVTGNINGGAKTLSLDQVLVRVHYTPAVVNTAPAVTLLGPSAANEGDTKSYSYGTVDAEGGPFTLVSGYPTCGANGTLSNASFNAGTGAGSFDCAFPDGPAGSTVAVQVADPLAAASNVGSVGVSVSNVAPTATFNAPGSVLAGSAIALSLTAPSDPSSADMAGLQYAFDCGSGYGGYGAISSASCPTVAGDGGTSRTVWGKVKDKDGAETPYSASVSILVVNVAPAVGADNASVTVNEGSTASNTGTWSDGNAGDTVLLSASVGSVSKSGTNASGTWSWNSGTTDGPAGPTTVTITANDGTTTTSTTFSLTVNNVAPTATFNAPTSVYWGNGIDVSLSSPSDPSLADTTAGFKYAFDCGSGYGAFGSTSSTTCTTSAADSGTNKTVKGKIQDKDGGESEYSKDVAVAKRPTQVVYSGDAAAQYSDPATLTATLTDNGGGTLQGTLLSGKTVGFTLGTQSTSATTNASGVASVPLALDKAPGGTTVATSFAGDTEYAASSDSDAFTIGKEDATVAFDPDNPAAVKVAIAGGASGPFSLLFDVQELVPDEGCPADPDNCPGDIGKATVAMKLVPVGPGGSVTGTCTPGSVTGSGYGAMLPVTCTFDAVAVNVYTVEVKVDGYYTGTGEDVLTVYDPSLGFTTGGGWFYWPGTERGDPGAPETYYAGDKTNFGWTMKYNKKGRNPQGSLLVIRHLEDGTSYRVKSNALEGLALGEIDGCGWASLTGKATYREPTWLDAVGNYRFTVYAEDCEDPGGGDWFWLQVKDPTGALEADLSLPAEAADNVVPVEGGNVVVPHN